MDMDPQCVHRQKLSFIVFIMCVLIIIELFTLLFAVHILPSVRFVHSWGALFVITIE